MFYLVQWLRCGPVNRLVSERSQFKHVLMALIRLRSLRTHRCGKRGEAGSFQTALSPRVVDNKPVPTLWFAQNIAHVGCLTAIRRSNRPVMARRKIPECRSCYPSGSSFSPSRRPSLFFRPFFALTVSPVPSRAPLSCPSSPPLFPKGFLLSRRAPLPPQFPCFLSR